MLILKKKTKKNPASYAVWNRSRAEQELFLKDFSWECTDFMKYFSTET